MAMGIEKFLCEFPVHQAYPTPTINCIALERHIQMLDLKIRNGVMINGAKTPRYQADLGIQGDRIVDIGNLADSEAQVTIDAAGHFVAPVFIKHLIVNGTPIIRAGQPLADLPRSLPSRVLTFKQ